MIDMLELAYRCKQYREFLGVTQEQVAKEVGMSRQVISDFERGENNSALVLTWYILQGFGCEDSDLRDILKECD